MKNEYGTLEFDHYKDWAVTMVCQPGARIWADDEGDRELSRMFLVNTELRLKLKVIKLLF